MNNIKNIYQAFFLSLFIIINFHAFQIIDFIYLQEHVSNHLNYKMTSWYFFLAYSIGYISLIIVVLNAFSNHYFTNNNKYIENKKILFLIYVLIFITLYIISFLHLINIKLFFTINETLDLSLLIKGLEGMGTNTTDIQSQLTAFDYLYFILPLLYFLCIKLNLYFKWFAKFFQGLLALSILLIMIQTFTYDTTTEKKFLIRDSGLNPIAQLTFDVYEEIFGNKIPEVYLNEQQKHSFNIVDNDLIIKNKTIIKKEDLNITKTKYNILFLLIEGLGTQDFLDTTNDIKTSPMPFLSKLSQESIFIPYTISTGGSTGQAIQSIMTGFNYLPNYMKNIKYPLWFKQSNKTTIDIFFQHAESLDTWTPKQLLMNNDMQLIDMDNITKKLPLNDKEMGIQEEYSLNNFIDNFIEKQNTKQTIGYYLNYNTHFPYFYYNEKESYTINEDIKNILDKQTNSIIKKENYYKSLNYYDRLIKKTFKKLEELKILEKTIVIIVGDHGQSFGQRGIWTHSGYYNDIHFVPTIIWQPNYIKHQIIEDVRTQSDLVPTMLDLLNINYEKKEFQGISLFDTNNRRYYFAKKGEFSLIYDLKDEKKLYYNKNKNECKTSELFKDKNEMICENSDNNLLQMLFKYYNYTYNIFEEKFEKQNTKENR